MPVRVLVVDDSATARLALTRALTDPAGGVEVVGTAADGAAALAAVERLAPDLVTLDVHLGAEDGVALAARLMATHPVPILVVTGVDPRDPGLAFRAVEAGALEVTAKPSGPNAPAYPAERARLLRLVRALASVPVVTRRPPRGTPEGAPVRAAASTVDVVLIGASTGGPPALVALLGGLPCPAPVPIVVVQHVAEGFGETFAAWLGSATGHAVRVAQPRQPLTPGLVVLAPDHAHLELVRRDLAVVREGPPRNYVRPCIDVLFESAAPLVGPRAAGVVLTGMGRDGADGLLALRRAGARTFAQDPAECVVSSMPEAAIALGAAGLVGPVDRLAAALAPLVGR